MKADRILAIVHFSNRIDPFNETVGVTLESGKRIQLHLDEVRKHGMRVGGFYLQQDDGCIGFSMQHPDTMVPQTFDFGQALAELKAGKRVARQGWNGKGMWLKLQVPDAHSKMTLPYIYMKTADDKLVPWLASQTDVLAEDWVLA